MNIAKEIIEGLFTDKFVPEGGPGVINEWAPAKIVTIIDEMLKDKKPNAELIESQNEWDFEDGNVIWGYYYGSSGDEFRMLEFDISPSGELTNLRL